MSNKYSKYFPVHDDFNIDDFPYYWIAQVYGLYINKMDDSLKKYGLDNSRRRIILASHARPNASISELAEMSIIKIPTATKIIYRLKDEGLLDTSESEVDSRVTRVNLTEKGHEMVIKINEITSLLFNDSFSGLKPGDIKKLNESLKTIKHNLE
ncbi:MarR family winged helix-turn-helix transcriptional regulator [Acinetobacter sp. MB5]|uniref:MarR family winged helix-turn-helix transcriptional regulator n=1 Tax=Acinetobacter sp. MB5 TaxID=2069438 RepID=UPI000DD02A79|nr:MarR family winged helix-turn-helix transcriptional regulator [Acinetobacter sp. MB5]